MSSSRKSRWKGKTSVSNWPRPTSSCVRTSFASQLPTMVDRNMAIDQAFTVCQTEEKKLQDVSDGAISAYRNTLKEEL